MPQPQSSTLFTSPFELAPARRRPRRHQPVHDELVVGYVRASKDRQRLTPAVQQAAMNRWCGENGKRWWRCSSTGMSAVIPPSCSAQG